MCEDCIARFDLEAEPPVDKNIALKKHRRELDKFTPMRRLAVLERDSFTCQNCHQSPDAENDIWLKVMYHVPITEDGKTVLENLTTRCKECLDR